VIAEAADWTGPSFQTCKNSVARKFETSRRREVLPFTHHAEVAALDPGKAGRGQTESFHPKIPREKFSVRAPGAVPAARSLAEI
jgi:hypothetical protein